MDRKYAYVISIAFIASILDQLTKFAVKQNAGINGSIPIIGKIFHITYITNTGSAFGLFKGLNLLFILISIAVMIILIFFFKRVKKESKAEQALFGLLLGGIIGNLADRLMLGYVIDFIDFRIWPVFNLADSLITIGVIGLIAVHWKK
mgnify:CR=1 FL=1